MPVFTKWLKRLRPPLAPRVFPTTFPRIDASTKHVTLKVFIRDQDLGQHANNEINTYYKIPAVAASSSHPGRHAVRSVLDHLPPVTSPAGNSHQCLVHAPLWDTARDLLYMNDTRRFTPLLTAMTLLPLLLALDFLHSECRLVHTDIKADNLAKEVANDHYIYTYQAIAMPESLGYTVAHPR
ncbi:hypothetical protein Sste5346_005129 [Sporothrix stenoceras]|uniref:Protein kinase domain-containing protein n=1 Tax=Sporothrix stenoceras TaxID=5173 RepID=A0ABR3Z4V4_9PEZI